LGGEMRYYRGKKQFKETAGPGVHTICKETGARKVTSKGTGGNIPNVQKKSTVPNLGKERRVRVRKWVFLGG